MFNTKSSDSIKNLCYPQHTDMLPPAYRYANPTLIKSPPKKHFRYKSCTMPGAIPQPEGIGPRPRGGRPKDATGWRQKPDGSGGEWLFGGENPVPERVIAQPVYDFQKGDRVSRIDEGNNPVAVGIVGCVTDSADRVSVFRTTDGSLVHDFLLGHPRGQRLESCSDLKLWRFEKGDTVMTTKELLAQRYEERWHRESYNCPENRTMIVSGYQDDDYTSGKVGLEWNPGDEFYGDVCDGDDEKIYVYDSVFRHSDQIGEASRQPVSPASTLPLPEDAGFAAPEPSTDWVPKINDLVGVFIQVN